MSPRSFSSISSAAAALCGLLLLLGAACSLQLGECTAPAYHHQKLSVYVRDVLNTTDFLTVPGATDIQLTGISAPFGSVFTVNDPVYTQLPPHGAPLSHNTVGSFQGTATFVSFDGHDMFLQISLRLQAPHHQEGTILIVGVFSYVNRSLPVAIVGGTGAYLHASGSATLTHVDTIPGDDQTFRVDLDVYLPSGHGAIEAAEKTMCFE